MNEFASFDLWSFALVAVCGVWGWQNARALLLLAVPIIVVALLLCIALPALAITTIMVAFGLIYGTGVGVLALLSLLTGGDWVQFVLLDDEDEDLDQVEDLA